MFEMKNRQQIIYKVTLKSFGRTWVWFMFETVFS